MSTAKSITTIPAVDPPESAGVSTISPIGRVTELSDGSLILHDIVVTSEAPDLHGEMVDYDSFAEVAPEFMKWATVAEMHDPERWDAGTVLRLRMDDDARRATADLHIVDREAVRKVLAKVYKAVSIHGEWRDRSWVTVAGRKVRKLVLAFVDEISLVPRGSNPDTSFAKRFVVAKRAADEPQTSKEEVPTMAQAAVAAQAADDTIATPEVAPETEAPAPAEAPTVSKADAKAAAKLAKANDPIHAAAVRIDTEREIAKALRLVEKARGAKKAAFGGKKAKPFKAAEAAETPAEEAAETPAEEAAEEADGTELAKSVALAALRRERELRREVAKARKVAKEAERAVRKMRGRSGFAQLTHALAKAGARHSAEDLARIHGIHDLSKALDPGYCAPAAPAAVHDVAVPAPVTTEVAKAADPATPAPNAIDFEAVLREAVPQISATTVAAMEATLGKRVNDLAQEVAKIGAAGAGGGPLNGVGYFDPGSRQFVPFDAATTGPVAKSAALQAAAEALPADDPLRREVSAAAAKADLMATTPWRR